MSSNTTKTLSYLKSLVWLIYDIIVIILVARAILIMANLNIAQSFENFVLNISDPLIAPFDPIVNPTIIDGYTVEWSILIAIFVYGIIALILSQIIAYIRRINYKSQTKKSNEDSGNE